MYGCELSKTPAKFMMRRGTCVPGKASVTKLVKNVSDTSLWAFSGGGGAGGAVLIEVRKDKISDIGTHGFFFAGRAFGAGFFGRAGCGLCVLEAESRKSSKE